MKSTATSNFLPNVNNFKESLCPELSLLLFDVPVVALLDSGSEISCISEDLFKNLCRNCNNNIPSIPVPSSHIITATGARSTKVNTQIFVPLNILNVFHDSILLVVKKLVTPVILGSDWLVDNCAMIDFASLTLHLTKTKQRVSCKAGAYP
jgi:hypothetical protein